ncbi:MAG: hypothetical protein PHD37_02950 [Gallionellaceae bacterium]|nr:hypothetical protein [Gallionellaceae bacterium]
MKRRIKRRVLLMGMAVAAGFPAAVLAQGSGKVDRHGYHYSNGSRDAQDSDLADLIQEAPEMRIDDEADGKSSNLLNKLRGLAEDLGSRVEVVASIDQAWKLELSQSEPLSLGATGHPKSNASKPAGVALRLKF